MQRTCYIHIPFCLKKCLFCSFTVSIGAEHRMRDYVQAVLDEMKMQENFNLSHVYLGGGTPGYLNDECLAMLMQGVYQHFQIAAGAEVTIETNPENVTKEKAELFKRLGINRISLGAQTFDEVYLKWLGRAHEANRIYQAVDILKDAGLSNISIDLMIGFPHQTMEHIERDIAEVIKLNLDHASVYTLTIEPNSRFYARQMKLDSDEKIAQFYQQVCQRFNEAGISQYEVSNFAKEGFESQHNQHYWQGGEYVGLGVGAHGYLNGRRFWHTDRLNDYIQDPCFMAGSEELTEETKRNERLIFGLRMNKGVNVSDLTSDQLRKCDDLVQLGLLEKVQAGVRVTTQGRLLLDEIAVRLL